MNLLVSFEATISLFATLTACEAGGTVVSARTTIAPTTTAAPATTTTTVFWTTTVPPTTSMSVETEAPAGTDLVYATFNGETLVFDMHVPAAPAGAPIVITDVVDWAETLVEEGAIVFTWGDEEEDEEVDLCGGDQWAHHGASPVPIWAVYSSLALICGRCPPTRTPIR